MPTWKNTQILSYRKLFDMGMCSINIYIHRLLCAGWTWLMLTRVHHSPIQFPLKHYHTPPQFCEILEGLYWLGYLHDTASWCVHWGDPLLVVIFNIVINTLVHTLQAHLDLGLDPGVDLQMIPALRANSPASILPVSARHITGARCSDQGWKPRLPSVGAWHSKHPLVNTFAIRWSLSGSVKLLGRNILCSFREWKEHSSVSYNTCWSWLTSALRQDTRRSTCTKLAVVHVAHRCSRFSSTELR